MLPDLWIVNEQNIEFGNKLWQKPKLTVIRHILIQDFFLIDGNFSCQGMALQPEISSDDPTSWKN